MSTITLIHGGGHKSHHWDHLRPPLERLGHNTIAPDVPMDQVGAGANDWAEVVIDAVRQAGDTDDVVLVGHSLAGLVLPVVASRFPVRRMVFLCALVPALGMSWSEYLAEHPSASTMPWGRVVIDEQDRLVMPWDLLRERFYQDCKLEDAEAAAKSVVPTAQTSLNEQCPIEAWPDVPSTYVLCKDDGLIGQEWSREIAVARLGGPALELPGGHSPMLSRPAELAAVLDEICAT